MGFGNESRGVEGIMEGLQEEGREGVRMESKDDSGMGVKEIRSCTTLVS